MNANHAKNSLGRSTGRQFNAAAMKREFIAKMAADDKRAANFDETFEAKRKNRDCKPITLSFGVR